MLPAGLEIRTPGIQRGPQAIIDASFQLESYDEELSLTEVDLGIFTQKELDLSGKDEQAALNLIGAIYRKFRADNKFTVILGGERLVSVPAVEMLKAEYRDLVVLSLGARADLDNTRAMRRIAESDVPLYLLGVRSISREEAQFAASNPQIEILYEYARQEKIRNFEINRLLELGKEVYLSINLSGFDPAEIPATERPEPEGFHYREFFAIFGQVCQSAKVVGFDVTGLCPRPGEERSDFYAARLVYKMLCYLERAGQFSSNE
jgi:agmatinase